MNEDRLEYVLTPQRHDKWSVLMTVLSWANMVSDATGQTLESMTIMTAQHASQLRYDKKFHEAVKEL